MAWKALDYFVSPGIGSSGGKTQCVCGEGVVSLGGGAGSRNGRGGNRRTGTGTGVGVQCMIREVVTVGTAAATVTSSGTHHVVLRVALATVTQVAVTAAVCYGAYLSPYAEGLKNRAKPVEESPGGWGSLMGNCVLELVGFLLARDAMRKCRIFKEISGILGGGGA